LTKLSIDETSLGIILRSYGFAGFDVVRQGRTCVCTQFGSKRTGLLLLLRLDNDHSHIIIAPAIVGGPHQLLTSFLR